MKAAIKSTIWLIPYITFLLVIVALSNITTAEVITVDYDGNADYSTIQDAINASADGDEIRVWEGTYYENVEVNKGVALIGNGTGNTTIDADYEGDVVTVSHDDVIISGFQIRRSGTELVPAKQGILINSDNVKIFSNYLKDNMNSIKIDVSINTIIANNTCEDQDGYGIKINKNCEFIQVIGNIVFADSIAPGIGTGYTKNHLIMNNTISGHVRGIYISSSENITIVGNILDNNDEGIALMESIKCNMGKNTISNSDDYGVWMYDSSNNVFSNNTCIDNQIGIVVKGNSNNNTIQYNNIYDNVDYGMKADENDGIVVNAENNWWGYVSGPYHAANNSDGEGNEVTDYVDFDPWSNGPITEKPVAYVDSITPDPGVEGDSVSFSGHGTDDGTITEYEWRSDLDGILSSSTSFNAILSVGTHTISFRVKDDYDVWSDDASQIVEVRPRPVATIDSIDPDPALEFEMITLSGSGTGGTITEYNWRSNKDGQLSTEQSFSSDSISWGIHTIYLKVKNDEDIWSYETSTQLIVHRPPTATIESIVPSIALIGEEVTFNGYGNDDSGVVRMVWESSLDGTLKDGMDYFFSLTNLSAGNHTITLRVQDEFGVWSEMNESYVIIHQPPQAIIDSVSPSNANEKEEIEFAGHGVDDNEITGYSWRSNLDGILSDTNTFSTDALSNGTHNILFKVKDEYDVWSEEVNSTIAINGIPRAQILSISPGSVFAGESITFTGYATDDGSIERYVWQSSFDGEIYNGTESMFSLSDLTLGEHTIYFTVQDAVGTWSEKVTLLVTVNANLVLTITDPSNEETVNGTILIKGEVTPLSSEDNSQILIRIDNGTWEESTGRAFFLNTCLWQYTWMSQSVENGQHIISSKAFDGQNWSNIATIEITVENEVSADLIELPQWNVGDGWTWFYVVDVDGEITTMVVTEEIMAKDVQQTENGTALGEPCYKLVAHTLFMGATIASSTAYLSVDTLELFEEDFEGEGMPLYLYGFMAELDWPLIITEGGPYQWSDAGNITVDAGTYSCYKFEGASGPLYYSPTKKHIVKAEMGEITFELKKDETTPNTPSDNDDDDEFFLLEPIGPLPLIAYLAFIVVIIIIGLAMFTKKGSQKGSANASPNTPPPLIPEPQQQTNTPSFLPPMQSSPPSVYPQQPTMQQQAYYQQQSQPQSQMQEAPPMPQSVTSGQWQCPQCRGMSDHQYAFCMKCGYKRQ